MDFGGEVLKRKRRWDWDNTVTRLLRRSQLRMAPRLRVRVKPCQTRTWNKARLLSLTVVTSNIKIPPSSPRLCIAHVLALFPPYFSSLNPDALANFFPPPVTPGSVGNALAAAHTR